jgi:hypothetical protein
MREEEPKKPSLSDIGHLFLSSIRDRQTGGAPRPLRRGPGAPPPSSMDLTQLEFEEALKEADRREREAVLSSCPGVLPTTATPIVKLLLASHLGLTATRRAAEYAAHLARVRYEQGLAANGAGGFGSSNSRVGLIEIDAALLRVTVFERQSDAVKVPQLPETRSWTAHEVSDALEELSWDVGRWLVAVGHPRGTEVRGLLSAARHWTLLAGCGDEAVVSAYRALKGALEQPRRDDSTGVAGKGEGPNSVSLALIASPDAAEADRVYEKLSGVCRQFLGIGLEKEPAIGPDNGDVAAHIVINAQSPLPGGTQAPANWEAVVADFVRELTGESVPQRHDAATLMDKLAEPLAAKTAPISPVITPAAAPAVAPVNQELNLGPEFGPKLGAEPNATEDLASTVIDLPAGIRAPSDVVYAVMAGSGDLTACPLRAPMCPEAGIAVNSEHRLVLVAVAGEDLIGMRAIAAALAWMNENRTLIAMALPQFAIDALRPAILRLLMDHATQSGGRAEALAAMLQSECVSIRTYRRLKWGGKSGLLLQAA